MKRVYSARAVTRPLLMTHVNHIGLENLEGSKVINKRKVRPVSSGNFKMGTGISHRIRSGEFTPTKSTRITIPTPKNQESRPLKMNYSDKLDGFNP